MAAGTITLQTICDGGNHVVLRLTVGAQTFDYNYNVDELRVPIGADERQAVVSTMVRFHCQGMTQAQTKAELAGAGISVVTS